ncbi:unnamed protein product [Trichogramma brassicae]|uniref:Uncharacterized protein n=1 Tax=Trichogramma brassicae TaxID=86971 RepID=A0A6H5IFB8_9HYME|nr:unnamed protein product [Trichogramma brassicae]
MARLRTTISTKFRESNDTRRTSHRASTAYTRERPTVDPYVKARLVGHAAVV